MSDPLLSVEDLHAAYDQTPVLTGVTLAIERGQVASLIGRNGAGKTTTLRSVMGILRPTGGAVVFDGDDVTGLREHQKTKRGIRLVPEERQLFPDLTVTENLRMGGLSSDGGVFSLDQAFEAFPRLDERRELPANHLSGGEQQMLAIARALMGRTELLLLDEPTEGLAPQIIEDVLEIIGRIVEEGVTVLLAEQNIHAAMAVADRHHVIDKGEIVFEGSTDDLESNEELQERHLGVGVEATGLFDD
ncbi:MAG: ABC transporter ATP-binding protein [Halobacteriales archaeon]|nr:ABC transporter ATP-binding protein [Halobacteriales archaeon]